MDRSFGCGRACLRRRLCTLRAMRKASCGRARRQRSLQPLVAALALCASGPAAAAPKVCGSNPALGGFQPASCPELKDDGVAPDESKGDGVYTAEVRLVGPVASPLEYKLLPSGAFDGSEIGAWKGAAGTDTCGLGGAGTNLFRNLQVPDPEPTRPVRFFYDTRALTDPSHARPPGDRSFGDDLWIRSPQSSCPSFLAVGDFQSVPFDRTVGAVALRPLRPGVLGGRWLATQALAAGWKWQVQEAAGGAGRRFGPAGLSYEPCTGDRVTVPSAVRLGDTVSFTFYAAQGRLQTTVQSGPVDGGTSDGTPQCPPPLPDMATGPIRDDLGSGEPRDLSGPGTDGGAGDLGPARPLPGIHCDYPSGRSAAISSTTGPLAALGLLLAAQALHRRRRSPLPLAGGGRGGLDEHSVS